MYNDLVTSFTKSHTGTLTQIHTLTHTLNYTLTLSNTHIYCLFTHTKFSIFMGGLQFSIVSFCCSLLLLRKRLSFKVVCLSDEMV